MGKSVYFYSYGCPRAGDSNFANFFNSKITTTNLRAVYRNDPVPTVPGHFLGFDHTGTEVHYYDCKNYIAYPYTKDDYPLTDLLALDDHSSYRCPRRKEKNERG
jgi:predicted lipase